MILSKLGYQGNCDTKWRVSIGDDLCRYTEEESTKEMMEVDLHKRQGWLPMAMLTLSREWSGR